MKNSSSVSVDELTPDQLLVLAAFKMGGVTYVHIPGVGSYWCLGERVVEDVVNQLVDLKFFTWQEYMTAGGY